MPDEQNCAEKGSQKYREGSDPRQEIEAVSSRRSQDSRAVFGRKAVEDLLVIHVRIDGGAKFSQLHRRSRTAHVVTFAQNLTASATAHQLMVQVVVALTSVASSHRKTNSDGECSGLQRSLPILQNHFSRRPSELPLHSPVAQPAGAPKR